MATAPPSVEAPRWMSLPQVCLVTRFSPASPTTMVAPSVPPHGVIFNVSGTSTFAPDATFQITGSDGAQAAAIDINGGTYRREA